jgi:integrase
VLLIIDASSGKTHDAVFGRSEIDGASACGTDTILDRRKVVTVAVRTIETAAAEAVHAIGDATTINATCSRRISTSHADTDASWSVTHHVYEFNGDESRALALIGAFRVVAETLVRKLREDNQRRRRISEDEEARLLAVAPPLLRSMIIAALDTGMRQGEMLALRFKDVDFARGLITLRGETTKSRRTRLVPIATARLRAVLEWLQLDAAGQEKPADALVFSDETGERVGSFRTAWVTAVLKAHDVPPA